MENGRLVIRPGENIRGQGYITRHARWSCALCLLRRQLDLHPLSEQYCRDPAHAGTIVEYNPNIPEHQINANTTVGGILWVPDLDYDLCCIECFSETGGAKFSAAHGDRTGCRRCCQPLSVNDRNVFPQVNEDEAIAYFKARRDAIRVFPPLLPPV